jgi:hypothetical protein
MLDPERASKTSGKKVFWILYVVFLVLELASEMSSGQTRFGLGELIAPACGAGFLTIIWWTFWGRKQPQPARFAPPESEASSTSRLRLRQPPEMDSTPSPFATEDDEAEYWLTLLRDGDDTQKIAARSRLARIFERRGMHVEATDLITRNIQAGEQTSENYLWLARLYRTQGDVESAEHAEAIAHARDPETKRAENRAFIYIAVAIGISTLSYWAATHGYGDGRYTIWIGPIIVGLRWLLKGKLD